MTNNQDKFTDPDAETLESLPEQSRSGMPREIGQYKVRRVIGSGGMGTVYEAIQESPRRKVAIKVMRSGVTSRSAMRRFEYESQILGRLSHPCIAQVYEAGTHDDGTGGVPYFAMEYIVGAKTLLEYAKQKDLNVSDRLILFEQVCDAVHHGHLKGIIHRDLKPDNILVDSSGNPKIIDFGVARATDSDMAVTTLQTNVGQLIGTVQYMSPEQCEADPDLIDARSDVYSLGVILYELLTGQPPYNLSSIPIYEATRLIREQQPTKMTTISDGIGGDLETVVSKSMEKDRDRRYQSAYELGQDITRFLENEPIHARRASMVYQLKMFARRNRGIVATVMTIAVALVLATVVSVYSSIRASQAETKAIVDRDRAVAAEEKVSKALLELENAHEELEETYEDIYVASKMLKELAAFTGNLLSLGVPRNAQGKMLTTHELALVATKEITKRFKDLPYLEYGSRYTIGKLLWEIGDLETAKIQLERSLEINSSLQNDSAMRNSDWLQTSLAYAKVLLDLGDSSKAREIIDQVIEGLTSEYGALSDKTLEAKNVLSKIMGFTNDHKNALALLREIVEEIDGGASVSREFELDTKVGLAGALFTSHMLSGAGEETRPLLEESLKSIETLLPLVNEELGALHPTSIDARLVLASCLYQVMRIEESVPILEQVYEDAALIYGPNHYRTAEAAGALGAIYFYRGIPEAESLLKEAIEIYTEVLGSNHLSGIKYRSTLGQLFVSQNRFEEAVTLLQQNMQDLPEGPSLSRTNTVGSLAYALMMQGKFEEGEPLWQEAVDDLLTSQAGELSQGVDGMRFIKAQAYILNSHPDAAEVADDFISRHIQLHGSSAPQLFIWTYHLASSYFQVDDTEHGLALFNILFDAIRTDIEMNEADPFTIVRYESHLALLCSENGLHSEALEILDKIIPLVIAEMGDTHEKVIELQSLRDEALAQLENTSQ
ncbi:MAG: serine/threonine protein kinase [Phycisphaerales bacterium]|nr:serine/threonine protein kinase [Phycisphaerales bacterium]